MVRLDARVLVFASDPQWHGLLPSQRITAIGTLDAPRGGDLTAAVLSAVGPPTTVDSPSWMQRAAGRLRAGLQRACRPLPPAPGGLLPGLVIGDTAASTRVRGAVPHDGVDPPGRRQRSQRGDRARVVLFVAQRCRAGPWLSAAVCAVALAGFVVLARPSPSVIRAAAMGGIALVALATGRSRSAMPALAVAVVVGLLIDPALAVDAGLPCQCSPPGRWSCSRRGGAIDSFPAAFRPCWPSPGGSGGRAGRLRTGDRLTLGSGESGGRAGEPAGGTGGAPATLLGVGAALISPLWSDGAELLAWLAAWPAGGWSPSPPPPRCPTVRSGPAGPGRGGSGRAHRRPVRGRAPTGSAPAPADRRARGRGGCGAGPPARVRRRRPARWSWPATSGRATRSCCRTGG